MATLNKTLVYGLQYGDCGKGKVSSYFAPCYNWNVRFNGGPNAGHTVYHNGKKYAFHHLPSGCLSGCKIALDAGMVIDLVGLRKELDTLPPDLVPEIYISDNAHLILEDGRKQDSGGSNIGTTGKGIGPTYASKANRTGLRVCDIEDDPFTVFGQHYGKIHFYDGLVPIKSHENALFESAQGFYLDIDYGHYPYVTSSSIMPSGYYTMANRIGVMKAYTSRVGDGPPYREQIGWLTDAGAEFGTTTGRARKCYWNDVQEIQHAIRMTQPDEIVVTKLDILKGYRIGLVDDGVTVYFNSVEEYKKRLLELFPQITYWSESPLPEMIRVLW